jgi:hypothetical protein
MTEFNLSNHTVDAQQISESLNEALRSSKGKYLIVSKFTFLHTSFVEEFIKELLKNEQPSDCECCKAWRKNIRKSAGEKLIC